MSFDLNNIVRSVAIAVVGLSITLPLGSELTARGKATGTEIVKSESELVYDGIVNNLTAPCIDYLITATDSKLEREAKTTIDNYFGGEVDYNAVCDYVLS